MSVTTLLWQQMKKKTFKVTGSKQICDNAHVKVFVRKVVETCAGNTRSGTFDLLSSSTNRCSFLFLCSLCSRSVDLRTQIFTRRIRFWDWCGQQRRSLWPHPLPAVKGPYMLHNTFKLLHMTSCHFPKPNMCWYSSSFSLAGAFCFNETCFYHCCRQKLYSSPEVRFGLSWLQSAAYVAAAHFHASIERSEKFMAPLPSRVLQESDIPPNIADLSTDENHTLYIFSWMTSVNQLLGKNIRGMERSYTAGAQTSETTREIWNTFLLYSIKTSTWNDMRVSKSYQIFGRIKTWSCFPTWSEMIQRASWASIVERTPDRLYSHDQWHTFN